jgi:hypothetical protein
VSFAVLVHSTVTTPNQAEMTCMKIAIKLASPTNHKSPYLN